jgi:type I restriction-modification system DNA methylase subunit
VKRFSQKEKTENCQKRGQKESEPVDYTLFNLKITFEFLKSHLWSAADILRGSLVPGEYRQPVMTLLFLKRLNDTFEENAENLIKKGMNIKEAYNKRRHNFFIPETARWSILAATAENIGEKIDDVCRLIERENQKLEGVLTNTKYNDKRKYPGDKLRALISHFNSPRLRNEDLEKEDIFGDAYEYLRSHVNISGVDKNFNANLSSQKTNFHAPFLTPRRFQDILEGRFQIDEIIRVDRKNDEHTISNKTFDFSSEI